MNDAIATLKTEVHVSGPVTLRVLDDLTAKALIISTEPRRATHPGKKFPTWINVYTEKKAELVVLLETYSFYKGSPNKALELHAAIIYILDLILPDNVSIISWKDVFNGLEYKNFDIKDVWGLTDRKCTVKGFLGFRDSHSRDFDKWFSHTIQPALNTYLSTIKEI